MSTVSDALRSLVRARPGCLDGKLLNSEGQPYVQANVGDDPLTLGYTYFAPWSDLSAKARPTTQKRSML